MAIENLPLFSAMNREEVKPPFPRPQRPLTSQESHFAIMEKVNTCIAEVNHFEQRVRYEMEQFISRTETENTGFKEAIQASYNAFMQTVQQEINNFEQDMQNNFDLYRNDIDKRIADFQTAINNEFETLQTNVLKASNDKIAEMEQLKIELNETFTKYKATLNEIVNNFKTQVIQHMEEQDAKIEEYKNYMVDNIMESTTAIFNQKAKNGEITALMTEVYGSERTFKGSLTFDEIQAISNASNGDYYYCTTDGHYYQRTETAWVDIGNGERLADDYEAFKTNSEANFNTLVKQLCGVPTTDGQAIVYSGNLQVSENTSVTDFIEVNEGSVVLLGNIFLVNDRGVCGYDASRTFVECFVMGSEETTATITIPEGVKYIRFNSFVGQKPVMIVNLYSSVGSVRTAKFDNVSCNFDETLLIKTDEAITLKADETQDETPHRFNVWLNECDDVEMLHMKTKVFSNNTYSISTRFFVAKPNSENFYFYAINPSSRDENGIPTAWGCSCYYYNVNNNTYTSVVSVSLKIEELNNQFINKEYNLTIRFVHGYAFIYAGNVYIGKIAVPLTGKKVAGINFRSTSNGVALTEMSIKNRKTAYAHFSVDDVQTCLKDLNDNKDTYTTIFDNTFLAKLRDIHLATGAVFSLYIFSKGVIDITTMTEKYKEQFTACSHWLKFGIHSPLSDDHYETFSDEDFVASYKEISEQIVRFAGRDCLDNMPRFGFFSANKSGLIALKNAKLGFVGTLSADDERTSNVGLDETERAILISHDSFYDAVNNIYYCRTTERFDSLTTEQAETVFNTDYLDNRNNDIYILFFHEGNATSAGVLACEHVAEKLSKLGIRFDYPENNIPEF